MYTGLRFLKNQSHLKSAVSLNSNLSSDDMVTFPELNQSVAKEKSPRNMFSDQCCGELIFPQWEVSL